MKSLGYFVLIAIGSALLVVILGAIAGGEGGAAIGVIVVILLIPYFLPAIVAYARRCPSKHAIFALNLFLGWTLVGWVVSIVWALKNYKNTDNIRIININSPVQVNDQAEFNDRADDDLGSREDAGIYD